MAAVGKLGYFTGAGHRRGDGKKEAVAVLVGWGRLRDLNPQPSDYKSDALPIAPSRHARTLYEASTTLSSYRAIRFLPKTLRSWAGHRESRAGTACH